MGHIGEEYGLGTVCIFRLFLKLYESFCGIILFRPVVDPDGLALVCLFIKEFYDLDMIMILADDYIVFLFL